MERAHVTEVEHRERADRRRNSQQSSVVASEAAVAAARQQFHVHVQNELLERSMMRAGLSTAFECALKWVSRAESDWV
jgi:hypothetical protein